MGKAKRTEAGRGRRLVVYIAPETWAALVRMTGDAMKRRGERVTVSGLVAGWIQERVEREGGR